MDVSIEMVISYFFLVVVFLIALGDGQKYVCPELSCGSSGLPIRFPFRLDSQPEYPCGYPGFNLSCTHRNETVLELPNSVKLFVTRIDYVSQLIQLTDAQHCLIRSLRGLNISSSPFQLRNVPRYDFEDGYDFDNGYTFFSCYGEERKVDSCIPCLSGPHHQVRAFKSYHSLEDLPNIASNCAIVGSFLLVLVVFAVVRKILNPSKGNGEEVINEVGTIGKIHHVNVVRLVGFCADGFRRALVYEVEKFLGSADTNNCFLGWEKLQDIAIGIAKGVEYLHQDVYSFGMLLLEIVGGRKNTGLTSEKSSQVYFPEWIYNLLEQKDDLRLYVEDDGDAEIAKKLAVVVFGASSGIQWIVLP
ncbi:putative RING-H2 finger protein ATL21A [Morella rubra]|uniref:Putative RING-H2 finger protein ATL21A n=1 Tax=Morella rubra TaxID=262757 RepID=A0A6A1UIU9_9ROSI|nr:putative RING-H2 finger protein ATL21A [Morella rubra]